MATSSYSLSSARHPEWTKRKRVSAQLSRLMASTSSRLSSEDSARRGVSEDGSMGARDSNRMSKAAAWVWYTRGIGQPAVLPTCQQLNPVVCARNFVVRSSRQASGASTKEMDAGKPQPSRFKKEANSTSSSRPADLEADQRSASRASQSSTTFNDSGAAALDALDQDNSHFKEQPSKVNTFLYDEFELSRLRELVEMEINKRSNNSPVQRCTSSSTVSSSSSRRMYPLSAIHKLFRRLYATREYSSDVDSPRKETGATKLRGNVQHVIHHHHHHYHHYRTSLDSPAQYHEPSPAHTHLPPEFVERRRRRHSESGSYLQVQPLSKNMIGFQHLVDDSLCTDAHRRPQR